MTFFARLGAWLERLEDDPSVAGARQKPGRRVDADQSNPARDAERDRWLAGAPGGAQGDATPNITPDGETGIGRWSAEEIIDYLETGMDPDGDFAGSSMAEVIDHSTGKLSAEDRTAITAYLRSVPAIRNKKSPSR